MAQPAEKSYSLNSFISLSCFIIDSNSLKKSTFLLSNILSTVLIDHGRKFLSLIIFDNKYSDGQFKKTTDNSLLMKYKGDFNFTSLKEGIENSVEWFNNNYGNCRK